MASGLAGLVLYATGSFLLVLLLSMAFSLVGVVVILRLESSAQVLIPHWEESLPPEARSMTMRSPGRDGEHGLCGMRRELLLRAAMLRNAPASS